MMSQMNELYQKVAGDAALQANFAAIAKDAESAETGATEERLVAFAKEAGFDVSIEEAKAYFAEMAETQATGAELTDTELDAVAGGKDLDGSINIAISASSLFLGCLLTSVISNIANDSLSSCTKMFE